MCHLDAESESLGFLTTHTCGDVLQLMNFGVY